MENLLDLRSTDKLFLEMSFNPLPRPPTPLISRGLERGALLDSSERQGKS